jgi:hypothetical protein
MIITTANCLSVLPNTALSVKSTPELLYALSLHSATMNTSTLITLCTLISCILTDHHYSMLLTKQHVFKLHAGSTMIGYVIVLADGYNNCNLIHWSSIKCRRVTRSVIASELYAMGHGFDYACVLKHTLDNIYTPYKQWHTNYNLYK